MLQSMLLITASLIGNPAAVDPVASLQGPTQSEPGDLVIIKATGTTGNDPKFDCFPNNTSWQAIKFLDNSYGIVFSTKTPGKYTFCLAVNLNSKTAMKCHTITIGNPVPVPPGPNPIPPGPGPVPNDPFYQTLLKAYQADNSPKDSKIAFSKVFNEAVKAVDSAETSGDLMSATLKIASELVPKGTLTNTKQVVKEELIKFFPNNVKMDDSLKKTFKEQFTRISNLLDAIP